MDGPINRGKNGAGTKTPERDAKTGRFVAGNCGGGRSRQDRDGRTMLREALPEAVETVLAIMRDTKARNADRLDAARLVIERVMGKAAQPILAEVYQADEAVMTISDNRAALVAWAHEILDVEGSV